MKRRDASTWLPELGRVRVKVPTNMDAQDVADATNAFVELYGKGKVEDMFGSEARTRFEVFVGQWWSPSCMTCGNDKMWHDKNEEHFCPVCKS